MKSKKLHIPLFILLVIISIIACSPAGIVQQPETPVKPPTQTNVEVSETQETIPPDEVFPLAGEWISDFIQISMDSTCLIGKKCGTFDIPSLPCSGSFIMAGIQSDDIFEFRGSDLSGTCGTGRDYLQLIADDTLQHTYRDESGESQHLLQRIDSYTKVEISSTSQASKIPVIFSHDGAPDDIAALLYISKHPDIEVIGVVNSYGEQDPQASSKAWASFLYSVLDMGSTPLAIGVETPLDPAGYEFPESWRTGANGFWSVELPIFAPAVDSREGYELIIDLVNDSPEKVTLLVTGAQTDMALALEHDPQIKDNIERIVIMGGAFHVKGNLEGNAGSASNDVAEWNIFVDATAADQVFNSGVPLTIMPLDGSENFWITRDMYDQLAGSDDPGVQLLAQLWENQFGWWGGDFLLWDILAAVAVTNPEYFSWEYGNLDVITEIGSQHGQTIVLDNINENNQYAVDNMQESLKTHILDIYLER
jgi:inosine-uridine nucleoside N-ribohydrolase